MRDGRFLVVFDINGTLLKRMHKSEVDARRLKSQGIGHDFEYGGYVVYNRPHVEMLVEFLRSHDIMCVLWTTAQKRNATCLVEYLERLGVSCGERYYAQDDCKVGRVRVESRGDKWVKDLRVVATDYGVEIERCILVDDSVDKSVYDQNFLCCREFIPGMKDDEIIEICRCLDLFLRCSERCVAKSVHS